MVPRRQAKKARPDTARLRMFERHVRRLNSNERVYLHVIKRLYGDLPDWLSGLPAAERIREALSVLRGARQSSKQMAATVLGARSIGRRPVISGPPELLAAVYLARVQWALGLPKARAIEELVGSDAALGNRVRDQRRTFSSRANASKKEAAAEKARRWQQIGAPLRTRYPGRSNSWLAMEIARKSGDKVSSIRVALPALGLKKSR